MQCLRSILEESKPNRIRIIDIRRTTVTQKTIVYIIQEKRLEWFGHVYRKPIDSWIYKSYKQDFLHLQPVARPPIRWTDLIKKDMGFPILTVKKAPRAEINGDRIVLEEQGVDKIYAIKSCKLIQHNLCTAYNVFSGIIYFIIIFLCYVKLKFVFNDIFRTGKIDFHWQQHMLGTDFLLPRVQLLRHYPVENQQPYQRDFLHHPSDYWHLLSFCFIYVLCFMF